MSIILWAISFSTSVPVKAGVNDGGGNVPGEKPGGRGAVDTWPPLSQLANGKVPCPQGDQKCTILAGEKSARLTPEPP